MLTAATALGERVSHQASDGLRCLFKSYKQFTASGAEFPGRDFSTGRPEGLQGEQTTSQFPPAPPH